MKVLMLTTGWPTQKNPNSSPFIYRQYIFLKKHGVDVDVFHLQSNHNPFNYLMGWIKVRKLIWKNSYNIIHAQWGHSATLAIPTKLPLVITFRGMDLEGIVNKKGNYSIYGKLLITISKFTSYFANEIVVVSKNLGDKLKDKNYKILPSGINLDLFKPLDKLECRKKLGLPDNKKLILFTADPNHPRKRFHLAKQSVKLLKDKIDCELIICTNQSHEDVVLFMNAADCLILTSATEGSPNVVKEALACNLSIVSTQVGDVEERKGSLNHFEICDSRPEEISNALFKVLSTKNEINNRKSVLHLDENIITSKLIEIYHKAINENLRNTKTNNGNNGV